MAHRHHNYDVTINIGDAVRKTSGKPFKSGHKVNIVSGITTNPNTGRPAFTFEDDDSIVDCWICDKVDGNV